MPNENDKRREPRSEGKKTVTRKTGSTSGTSGERNQPAAADRARISKPKAAEPSQEKTARPRNDSSSARRKPAETGTEPKKKTQGTSKPRSTPVKPAAAEGKASGTSGSAQKKASGADRNQNSARDDYRRFSEDIRTRSRNEKSLQAKETQRSVNTRGDVRKGKSHSRSKLMTALTYVMIVFAFAALMITLSMTVFFKTDSVKISSDGREYYSEDSIIEASGIEMGQNIFSIDLEETENIIEKEFPYIENCEIRRVLPTAIVINITYAEPAGVINLQSGERLVVSTHGKSLEKLMPLSEVSGSDVPEEQPEEVSQSDVSGSDISATDIPVTDISVQNGELREHSVFVDETLLPEIEGLEILSGTNPGEYIEVEDKTALVTLNQLTQLLNKYNLPPDMIDLSAGNLYTRYDDRILIKLGSGAELETKVEMASEIILNRLSEYDSGRVDVSSANVGYFTPEYMLNQRK